MSIGAIIAAGTFTTINGVRNEYEIMRVEEHDQAVSQQPFEVILSGCPEIIVPCRSLRKAIQLIGVLAKR